MVKRVGRDTAVRIDKRTATGIGCLVTIGIVLALMIVTFHAIARGDVPENPLTPVGVVLELVWRHPDDLDLCKRGLWQSFAQALSLLFPLDAGDQHHWAFERCDLLGDRA